MWAFSADDECLSNCWSLIPKDTDILLTHTPCAGILDRGYGSQTLSKRVFSISNISYHVFGHIHDCSGSIEINGKNFINCAVLDGRYEVAFEPKVFELD